MNHDGAPTRPWSHTEHLHRKLFSHYPTPPTATNTSEHPVGDGWVRVLGGRR